MDLVVAQLREEQQSLLDKKQLLAEALREKRHLLNMKRRRLDNLTRRSGVVLWTVYELATIREKTCDFPDTGIIFIVANRFRELNWTVKNRSLLDCSGNFSGSTTLLCFFMDSYRIWSGISLGLPE